MSLFESLGLVGRELCFLYSLTFLLVGVSTGQSLICVGAQDGTDKLFGLVITKKMHIYLGSSL